MAYSAKTVRFLAGTSVLALLTASACGDDASSTADGGTTDEDGAAGKKGDDDAGGAAGGSEKDASPDVPAHGDSRAADTGSPDAPGCVNGCECKEGDSCDYECAADCMVECKASTCTATCPEGGCKLDADLKGSAQFDCSGGDCTVDCDNESICGVNCLGGGCDVVCDVDSTCTVTCSDKGKPCAVTCENGGRAVCEGNCELQGCDDTCVPDETYKPEIDPKKFSNVIDNPLFPLPVGARWTYSAPDEAVETVVTDKTKTIMGVVCVAVQDTVKDPKTGNLIEDTTDWYAQDSDGNVWYFGEATAEYLDGKVATTAGSWVGGVDGAFPGIIMKASPKVGDEYRQEYLACEAEDWAEVIALGESITVSGKKYTKCVRTRDFTPLEPSANEFKTYCPGIGVVQVSDITTGEKLDTLETVEMP